jgi:hypothetical protein
MGTEEYEARMERESIESARNRPHPFRNLKPYSVRVYFAVHDESADEAIRQVKDMLKTRGVDPAEFMVESAHVA